jgi:VIT1/CCC1 family predicted Fe2+/Mn2+ transporter
VTTEDSDREYHARFDPHGRGAKASEVILGGQDGLVNVLGVILGVAAATSSTRVVLAAGLAAAFAESVSMAAVAYTATRAEGDRFESERAREYRHVQRVPAIEREEIRELYERKGLSGELLGRVVDAITANPDVWVAVMMAEEHGLAPVARKHALRSSLIVGTAALVGSLIPLVPFFVTSIRYAIWLALASATVALFTLGAWKARRTVGRPIANGVELALIGMASALVGYAIGAIFKP